MNWRDLKVFSGYEIKKEYVAVYGEVNLIAFLKENNALEKFENNFHNWHNVPLVKLLERYDNQHDRAFVIRDAFGWDETPEGYKFWHDLNIKWKHICFELAG